MSKRGYQTYIRLFETALQALIARRSQTSFIGSCREIYRWTLPRDGWWAINVSREVVIGQDVSRRGTRRGCLGRARAESKGTIEGTLGGPG